MIIGTQAGPCACLAKAMMGLANVYPELVVDFYETTIKGIEAGRRFSLRARGVTRIGPCPHMSCHTELEGRSRLPRKPFQPISDVKGMFAKLW